MSERYYEQKHFVEDMSLYFEQMGLPRMAGRVLGVLLISDPPEQSLNDVAEVLQASKSSMSTTTRLLSEMGLIERVCACASWPHCTRSPSAGSNCSKTSLRPCARACRKRTICSR
jgi:hypothetical protein